MDKPKKEDVALINKFDYSKCKHHNVDFLETEYITAKKTGTIQEMMMKGYVFPIRTKGNRVLFKPWNMQTIGYFDKHLSKDMLSIAGSIRTRPKLIIKLKYPTQDNVGGWNTISPRELIMWHINDCKRQKFEITEAHINGWQEQLEMLTFLKKDE